MRSSLKRSQIEAILGVPQACSDIFMDSLASCLNIVANLDVSEDIKSMLTEGVELVREKKCWESEASCARQTHYVREKLKTFQHKYLNEVTRSGTLEQQLASLRGQIEGLVHEQLKLAEENYNLREEIKTLQETSFRVEDKPELSDILQEASKWRQVCNELSKQVRSLIVQSCDPSKSKLQFTISRVEDLQNQNVELLAMLKDLKLKAMKNESEIRQMYALKLETALNKAQKLEAEREFAKSVLVQSYSGVPHSRVTALERLVNDKEEELKISQKTNLQQEEELTWLKNKVQSLENHIHIVHQERDSLRDTLKGADNYREQLQKAVRDLEQQLIDVSKRRNLMEQVEEKMKLVAQLEDMKNQLQTLHQDYLNSQSQLDDALKSNAELNTALQDLKEDQLKSAEEAEAKLATELQSVRQELLMTRKANKLEVSILGRDKARLEEEVAKLKEVSEEHEKCPERLQEETSKQNAKATVLKQKYGKMLQEAKEQLSVMSTKEEDLKHQIEELNEQIEEITEENLNLQKPLESVDAERNEETNKALADAVAELEDTRNRLSESQAETSKLTLELENLQAAVTADQFTEVDSERVKALELEVVRLKSELEGLQNIKEAYAVLQQNQEAIDKKYADRIDKARKLIKDKHENVRRLQQENERLNAQVVAPEQVGKLCNVLHKLLELNRLS